MANTNITYRAVKGSALTFSEMDQNFASFFYSASAYNDENGFNRLRLHYTGSSLITGDFDNDRYLEVVLPDAQGGAGGAEVAGTDTTIQFNDGGSFGGDPEFVFNKTGNTVSLGNGSSGDSTLDIRGTSSNTATVLKLRARDANNSESQSYINITKVNQSKLQIGLLDSQSNIPRIKGTSALEIGIDGNRHLKLGTSGTSIGVGSSLAEPNKTLTVIGEIGVGDNTDNASQSTIKSLSGDIFSGALGNYLPENAATTGLIIASPSNPTFGGNITIGINASVGKSETFSIFSGNNGTFNSTIATFKADGKIGFNQRNPVEILHVEGNITGSGNINVKGTGTIQTIAELATLTTDFASSNQEYARTLVKSSTGLIQYMDAAPVPKGGIIMWSGAVDNIPIGWRLCDGGSENGVDIPDLRERFIVGAGGNNTTNPVGGDPYDVGDIGGSKDAVLIQHNHGGTITGGNHRHAFEDGYFIEAYESPNDVISGYDSQCVGNNFRGSGDTDSDNRYIWERDSFTAYTSTHSHTIPNDPTTAETGVNKNLPPYYALAFIIYVGAA